MPPKRLDCLCIFAWITLALAPATSSADERYDAAIESVTAAELYEHVATLADDAFEGRAVGSRGGYAAARYIVEQLRHYRLTPAGDNGGFFQPIDRGGRNVLAIVPGTDPQLQHEYVVVGAHYDHVGDGSSGHALGAIGSIYNGADDNASGIAVLLEIIEALSDARIDTRRSLLFAFWDGEEQGLLGSKHWFAHPTVPVNSVRLDINLDMVGRLRDGHLQIVGSRTGYGLRRLFSGHVDDPLWLDFTWELTANSDHWPFVEHQIPIVMLHTGLHADYHRPTDDVEKINSAGMEEVGRYLLATVIEVSDADQLPPFRPAGRNETLAMQRSQQQRISFAALSEPSSEPGRQSISEPGRPRPRLGPRLGITWRTDEAEPGSVYLTLVAANSPAAAAGLAVDDRIYAINGRAFADDKAFRKGVVELLDAGAPEFTLQVESRGHVHTVTIHWHPETLAAKVPV